ncbi:MAG TPA: CDP-alcohol phosphatidyltransferase family protein [Nitrospiria bacterium]|nr:CDP-alcohol phosphatidyltransferase family protein [Nitrospiria bacterium]
MNLPNVLTVFRILLIPVFVNSLIYRYFTAGIFVLMLAYLTDGLDGFFARILNQETVLGAYLDPIADKLLLISSFITLSITRLIPEWVAVFVVSRDLVLILGSLVADKAQMKINLTPTWAGKAATVVQYLYVFLIVLFVLLKKDTQSIFPLLVFMLVLTAGTGIHYLVRGATR